MRGKQGVRKKTGLRKVAKEEHLIVASITYRCIVYLFLFDKQSHSFFQIREVALPSHICFPVRIVFHQHFNSHIAYPGSPPEPSNHTRGQFLHLPSYPLLRLL